MDKKMKLTLIIGIPVVIAVILTATLIWPGNLLGGGVTYEKYEQITYDMSYEEVAKILGKGTMESEAGDGESRIASYSWKGKEKNSRVIVVFYGDKMGSKSQLGLQ